MDRGYFKMWRMWFDDDSPIWPNESLVMLMVWLCKKATHKKRYVSFKTGKGNIEVLLEPGQLIFGRHTAAKQLKIKPSTIWKRITKLKTLGFCDIESNRQYSIITINNYKELSIAGQSQSDKQSDKQGTSREQAGNTKKTLKTLDNLDNKPKPSCVKNKIPEGFEEFYQAYPKKKNKPDALNAWKQVFFKPDYEKYHRPVPLLKILASIEANKKSDDWRRSSGQYVPYPGTWLRAHGFNDLPYAQSRIPLTDEEIEAL